LISSARNMATQQYAIAPYVEEEETVSCHGSAKVFYKKINDDFEFPIDMNDTLFTLALNFSNYDNEKVGNIITKMAVIKESYHINIDELSKVLAVMGINELYVFSIQDRLKKMKVIKRDSGSLITYTEMK
jgi:ADP-dependent phosphofructokinase/glucokinase